MGHKAIHHVSVNYARTGRPKKFYGAPFSSPSAVCRA